MRAQAPRVAHQEWPKWPWEEEPRRISGQGSGRTQSQTCRDGRDDSCRGDSAEQWEGEVSVGDS